MKACAALELQHVIVRFKPLPALQHKAGSAGIKINLGVAEGHLQTGFISLGISFNSISMMLLCMSWKYTKMYKMCVRPLAVTQGTI